MSILFTNDLEQTAKFYQITHGNIHARTLSPRFVGALSVGRGTFTQFANVVSNGGSFDNSSHLKNFALPNYSLPLQTATVIALALIAIGLIVGYLFPGPITGLVLPIGLTLWFFVGYLARREDSK